MPFSNGVEMDSYKQTMENNVIQMIQVINDGEMDVVQHVNQQQHHHLLQHDI